MLPHDQRRAGGADGERCRPGAEDEFRGLEKGVGGSGQAV